MLRIFAITLLTYLGTRLSFWVLTVLFDFWRGPAALYFEFFVYPLYAIFAVVLVGRVAALASAKVAWQLPDVWIRSGIFCTAAALVIIFAYSTSTPDHGFAYPPKPTALTASLEAELGIVPPAPFRGRVATLTGRALDRGVTWLDLHGVDGSLDRNFGNEMRLVGLHYFGVPGLFEYGSTMTPAFYAVASRLLTDPRDTQMRSVSVLRRYEPRILAMLGIRYVVTDAPLPGTTLIAEALAGGQALYLYAVPHPNLATYSPTRTNAAATATDILLRMGNPDFDPRREVIGTLPDGGGSLMPAHNPTMVFDGVSLAIEAQSDGRSVLLLPVEFSRCLAVTARSATPVLFRANLLLTGVLFSDRLDATVALRNGPFVDPTCRLRDLTDLLTLGIRDVPRNVWGNRR
jgi:hypothetical protein